MTDHADPSVKPWRLPVGPRDPREAHRAATNLELLFDLCFVDSVAYAGVELHHAIAANHAGTGVVSYLTVFFAIWSAWMNFTWHASAYDNDDGVYRLASLVQITGCLIVAAGIPRAFELRQFDVVFAGYVVMRVALVFLWLRAAIELAVPGLGGKSPADALAPAPHRGALRPFHHHRARRVRARGDVRWRAGARDRRRPRGFPGRRAVAG